MEIIKKIKSMQELSEKWRRDGNIISCVPTMGFLNQGHMELLKVGREKGIRFSQGHGYRRGKDSAKIRNAVKKLILDHPFTEIDYITICDPEKLTDMKRVERPSLLALAVRVGKTRLIDNLILREN